MLRTRRHPWVLHALTTLALVLAAVPGAAQPRRPTRAQVAEAARIYQQALQLMEGGNPAGALPLFQQAYDIASPPNALFNIGACHEALRNFERALEFYERYLVEAPNADDRRDVQARIAAIRGMRSQLAISSEPTGAQIFVDNAAEPAGVTDRELELTPGNHVITLRLQGYQDSTKSVTLLIGERKALPFSLRVVEGPPPTPEPRVERIVVERPGRTRTIVVTREVQSRERDTPYYIDLGLGGFLGFMTNAGDFAPNFNGSLSVGRGIPIGDRLTFDAGVGVFFGGVGGDSDSGTILLPGFRAQPRLRLSLNQNLDVALVLGAGLMLAIGADDDHHPILAGAADDTVSLFSFEFGLAGRYMLSSGLGFGVTLGLDYTLKSSLADGSPLFKGNLLRVLAALAVSYRF